jgi:hypothetical protein
LGLQDHCDPLDHSAKGCIRLLEWSNIGWRFACWARNNFLRGVGGSVSFQLFNPLLEGSIFLAQ